MMWCLHPTHEHSPAQVSNVPKRSGLRSHRLTVPQKQPGRHPHISSQAASTRVPFILAQKSHTSWRLPPFRPLSPSTCWLGESRSEASGYNWQLLLEHFSLELLINNFWCLMKIPYSHNSNIKEPHLKRMKSWFLNFPGWHSLES